MLVNSAGTAVSTVAGFAYQIALARYLHPDGFGLFSEVSAVAVLAATIGGLGTSQLAVRELASDRATPLVLGSILAMAAAGGLVAAFGVIGLSSTVGGPVGLYVIASFSVPFTAILGVLSASFVARDEFRVPSAVRAGGAVLFALLVGGGIAVGASLSYFVGALVVVEVARVGFVVVRMPSRDHAPIQEVWAGGKRRLWMLLREAAPYGALAFIGVVHLRVDVVMVRWIAGAAEAGAYAGAARFSYAAAVLPSLLLGVLFPRFVRLRERNEAAALFRTAAKVLFWAGCCAGVLGAALAPWIIELSLGAEYGASVLPLRLLMASLAFTFLQSVTGTALASGRDLRSVVGFALAVTVLNVILNAWLIPVYGAAGAAAATLLSELASVAGYGLMACRQVAIPVGTLVRALVVPWLSRSERMVLLDRSAGAPAAPR